MRIVIQRVRSAFVTVDQRVTGSIGQGLLLLLGVGGEDHEDDVEWLVKKVVAMRIFDDSEGVMNLSVRDIDGEALVVSQFTLMASTKKGTVPPTFMRHHPTIRCLCMSCFAVVYPMKWGKKFLQASLEPICKWHSSMMVRSRSAWIPNARNDEESCICLPACLCCQLDVVSPRLPVGLVGCFTGVRGLAFGDPVEQYCLGGSQQDRYLLSRIMACLCHFGVHLPQYHLDCCGTVFSEFSFMNNTFQS